MTLSELKKHDPKAYERYVEMMVEDCKDVFVVTAEPDQSISVRNEAGIMRWNPKATNMCIGAGWEMMRRRVRQQPSEEELR